MHKQRKASGVHASSHKPTKMCAMKMILELEKNDAHIKMLFMEEALYNVQTKKSVKTICTSCWEMIVDTMKVLFV